MLRIRDIVRQALMNGYLTIEAENQLRLLLKTKYDWEDLNAFRRLQEAAMSGFVSQESRELMNSQCLSFD
jgi:DNA repair photolyase